jgi:predicted AlkP superfamily phosphohydrolase/phosphomutase
VNVEKFNQAIDSVITGLTELKGAFSSEVPMIQNSVKNDVNIELLARQMAYSYSTLHPEYKVDSQFRNLTDMVNSSKITYVIAWVRKKGTEGLEEFFKKTQDEKQTLMKEALNKYEKEIKEVFTKRFS